MVSTGSKLNSRNAQKLRPTSAENCECQCDKDHPTFREDERKCVNDLPGNLSFSMIISPSFNGFLLISLISNMRNEIS